MADSDKPKKRQLKNPETFRERAIKASEDEAAKPARSNKLPLTILKAIFRPVARGYKKLKTVKSLKPLFAVLGFIGKIIFPKYFRSSFEELKKVTWPSFKQSRQLTYAVLVFAIVFGASVAAVDWGLGKIFRHILLK